MYHDKLNNYNIKMDAMKSKMAEEAQKTVTKVLKEINSCDTDELFSDEMDIEGSVKTNLKVSEPDEFDYSWPLALTDFRLSRHGEALKNENCKNHNHRTRSACLEKVEWESSPVHIPKDNISFYCIHSDMEEFKDISEGECIPPRMVSEYLHKCVSEAAKVAHADVTVRNRVYGPAVRFTIADKKFKHNINVDITPRVDVSFSKLQKRTQQAVRKRVSSFPKEIQNYICINGKLNDLKKLYLVPKSDEAWQISFANYENLMINKFGSHKGNFSKKCLRQSKLKLLKWRKRATNGKSKLINISSYLLKTLLLEMITEKPKNSQWSEGKLDDNNEEMLMRLSECADGRELPAFFDEDINLLENVSKRSRQNLIQYIREEIDSSSDNSDNSDEWLV